MNVSKAIAFSGLIWFFIGAFLFIQGIRLFSIFGFSFIFFFLSLAIGFIKGKWILSKTVKRITAHIQSLPKPIRISKLYPKSYYLLISTMMLMGMGFSFFKLNPFVRGGIDIAIGTALLIGAFYYFQIAKASRNNLKTQGDLES